MGVIILVVMLRRQRTVVLDKSGEQGNPLIPPPAGVFGRTQLTGMVNPMYGKTREEEATYADFDEPDQAEHDPYLEVAGQGAPGIGLVQASAASLQSPAQ